MSNSIKNIIEIQESGQDYGRALEYRAENIINFSALGPPDLCYLTKEFKKNLTFSKNDKRAGFYHYIYGLDLSTPASISVYISKILKQQETEGGWFKSGQWSITKATFCIYDAFRKVDVRAQVSIPGSMKIEAINADEEVVEFDDVEWDSVYVSSLLRSFNPTPVPHCKFYQEIENSS
mmetsp:Transcript_11930/g.10295  ORF Transcript_11930/g.10295 Transcript_11930/m.10295 type:complete len:178 (+) Transcript_11930:40-573(+)